MRSLRSLPLVLLAACTAADPAPEVDPDSDDGTEYEAYVPDTKGDGATRLGGPISFSARCAGEESVTIAAMGDFLMHGNLQRQAYASGDRFTTLWSEVADLMAQADISYGNLEGPTASGLVVPGREFPDPGLVFDSKVYTGYPRFNYNPVLVQDLVDTGLDVVSTANNHALDRGGLGADRTIDELSKPIDTFGTELMPHTGTIKRDGSGQFQTYTEANGFKISWIACTFSTNQIPDPKKQVLGCYTDNSRPLLNLVRQEAANPEVDAVIVTPHWGIEYTANPRLTEKQLAHKILDAGATVVFGGHPHVLQPWEKYITKDDKRETFVIYSLGNFVSGQRDLPRRSTILLYLGLVRDAAGKAQIEGVRYIPLHMTDVGGGVLSLQAIDRVGGLTASRGQTVRMFGEENLQHPDESLDIARCPTPVSPLPI